jgi:hypothetical protein
VTPARSASLLLLLPLLAAACSGGGSGTASTGGGGKPEPLVFLDHTADGGSGVDFVSLSRPDAAGYGQGVAVADVDGDGDLDLFLPQDDGPCALWVNDGRARFTETAAVAGVRVGDAAHAKAASFLDYDRDGDPDLFVGRAGEGNLFFRNRGDGTFEDVTAETGLGGGTHFTVMGAVGDFDGDGYPDLYECNFAITDYDLPVDLQMTPAPNRLWRNGGDGTFTDVGPLLGVDDPRATWAAHWWDADGDGDQDLLVANDHFFYPGLETRDRLYVNPGEAGGFLFEDRAAQWGFDESHFGMAYTLGDLDGDGLLDVYVSDLGDNELRLGSDPLPRPDRAPEKGMKVGQEDIHLLITWGTAIVDLDADGWNDLVALNGHLQARDPGENAQNQQPPYLFLRRPGEKGEVWENYAARAGLVSLGCRGARGCVPCDLNGDGLLDLVISTRFGPARVVLGDLGGARPPWYGVRLRGTRSTREGLGAMLELRRGSRSWVRLVTTGGQYGTCLPPEEIFHTGPETGKATLVVRWPSGTVQEVVPRRNGWTLVEEPETP